MLVDREDVGPDVFKRKFQWLAAFFYTDDGLFSFPSPAQLQAALDVLTGFLKGWASGPMLKNEWGGVSDLLHYWRAIGGGVYAVDDGRRSILLGEALEGGLVSVL